MGLINVSSSTVFIFSILLGVIISVIFDFFMLFNFINKKNRKIIFFSDISFMCIAAILSFLYLLAANYGIFRLYIIIGEAIGFILHRYTLGKLTFKLIKSIYLLISKFYRKIIVQKVVKVFVSIANRIYEYIMKTITNISSLIFEK